MLRAALFCVHLLPCLSSRYSDKFTHLQRLSMVRSKWMVHLTSAAGIDHNSTHSQKFPARSQVHMRSIIVTKFRKILVALSHVCSDTRNAQLNS
ncbi:hypothetical protein BDZ91DRAFT_723160 [Kalaharituber pfeilii]|nr:hypothetical protein BDZ91DRAFT_723160 [Kalaharituber pfeilii]